MKNIKHGKNWRKKERKMDKILFFLNKLKTGKKVYYSKKEEIRKSRVKYDKKIGKLKL